MSVAGFDSNPFMRDRGGRWAGRRIIDLTGMTFGRLYVVERGPDRQGQARWWCVCECGNDRLIVGHTLRYGRSKSCGCLRAEQLRVRNYRHGAASRGEKLPEYLIWLAMLQRCRNPNARQYKDYGGRGIYVCDEWQSFDRFIADMGLRPRGAVRFTVERKDNDGPYAPWNCVWATYEEQARNRRPLRLGARA